MKPRKLTPMIVGSAAALGLSLALWHWAMARMHGSHASPEAPRATASESEEGKHQRELQETIEGLIEAIEEARTTESLDEAVHKATRFVVTCRRELELLDYPRIAGAMVQQSRYSDADRIMVIAEEDFVDDGSALTQILCYRRALGSLMRRK